MKLDNQEQSNYEMNTAKSKDQTFLGKVCLHEFKNVLLTCIVGKNVAVFLDLSF